MMIKKITRLITLCLLSLTANASLSEPDRAIYTQRNYLTNPGAENSTASWTASGGTFTTNTAAANVDAGNASFSWDSGASSQTMATALYTITAGSGLSGAPGVASCRFKCATGNCTHTIQAYDGTNILSSATITSTNSVFQRTSSNFVFPTSGAIQLRISSTASDEPPLYIDKCFMGLAEDFNIFQVSQATLYGSAFTPLTANCTWARTGSTTLGDFTAIAACPVATVTGQASAPATKIPAITFSSLPAGEYYIVATGSFFGSAGTGAHHFTWTMSDGTSLTGKTAFISSNLTGTNYVSSLIVAGRLSYTTSQSNITIQLQCQNITSSTDTCLIDNRVSDLQILVYRFPTASQTVYGPDNVAWNVDANIRGANPSLGVTDVLSYTEITNAGLTLVNNSAGNTTAQIACASGTASTGTTCSVNESVGIAFVLPVAGKVKACASFSHEFNLTLTGTVTPTFQISETSNTSSAVITNGNERLATGSALAGVAQEARNPIKLCSVFNFQSSGQKTLRLNYTQSTTATITSNIIMADAAGGGAGNRDIHWEVYPLTQNFPAPLLVGSVTSNSSGLERVERASFGGSTVDNSVCSSSPCTIWRQSGAWLSSITRNTTGSYSPVINSGIFSATPSCSFTCGAATTTTIISSIYNVSTWSSTSVSIGTVNGSNVVSDAECSIICQGPR